MQLSDRLITVLLALIDGLDDYADTFIVERDTFADDDIDALRGAGVLTYTTGSSFDLGDFYGVTLTPAGAEYIESEPEYGVPMFGYLPPPMTPRHERVICIDFTDITDERWLAEQNAKGVRRDRHGEPMMHYMAGRTAVLIDMRGAK